MVEKTCLSMVAWRSKENEGLYNSRDPGKNIGIEIGIGNNSSLNFSTEIEREVVSSFVVII